MRWHVIEGVHGCAYAKEYRCVAVIVDALRASATAAMLLHEGATEILAAGTVDQALAFKAARPHALLFGERGGLPPAGFDHGNSPRECAAARGHSVVFTTTTGTARLLDAMGAPVVYMGTTVNAAAVVQSAARHDLDVVLIPAGKAGDPEFDASEDWAAAVSLALLSNASIGEGAVHVREVQHRLELDGLPKIFEDSPHGMKLRELGLGEDVTFCARLNVTDAVPQGQEEEDGGVLLRAATV